MIYRLLADLVMAVHFAFIAFVVLGGILVLRWNRLAWLHVPAAVWGVLIEWAHWTCPLTPLENRLRRLGGLAGYDSSFIEHYLLPLIYPAALTRQVQFLLGAFVLAVNAGLYGWLLYRRAKGKGPAAAADAG